AHADPAALAQRVHERARVRAGAVACVHAVQRKRVEGTFPEERPHVVGEGALGGAEPELHGRLCCRVACGDASAFHRRISAGNVSAETQLTRFLDYPQLSLVGIRGYRADKKRTDHCSRSRHPRCSSSATDIRGGAVAEAKGDPSVRLADDTIRRAEIHWHEAHGVGRKEIKIDKLCSVHFESSLSRIVGTSQGLSVAQG